MKKKSILFLTNAYPDFDSSHRGHFIKKMAMRLQNNGYQISVVTPKIYGGSSYFEKQNGIKVYRFPFFSGNKLLIEYDRIPYLRMIFYYISGFLLTTFVIFKHRCRLIHAHWAIPTGLIGVLAGALLNKPLIVTIHGSDWRMVIEGPPWLKKIFLCVCKKAKLVNCVSEVIKKEIEQVGIHGGKISTIPMGVDDSFLEVGKHRERKLCAQPATILSNRNLLPIYNVSLLIRTVPIILQEEPDTKFLIAGDGPERENLEKETKQLNVDRSVQFLGRIPHDEMPNLLAQADIYVSTSLYDGTSVSLLEAMASGVFPVVTNITANREWIIEGENGFLVPTNEEEFFANRIVEAIRNIKLKNLAYEKNLKIVEARAHWRHSISKTSMMYEDYFH